MAISHIPASIGHNFTPEYQISPIPFIVTGAAADAPEIQVNIDGKVEASGTSIRRIEFPKITQWIQFDNQSGTNLTIYFSRKQARLGTNGKGLFVKGNTIVGPLRLRCTNIYLAAVNSDLNIVAGLTSIDRSEFTEVVEAFLGDDIT